MNEFKTKIKIVFRVLNNLIESIHTRYEVSFMNREILNSCKQSLFFPFILKVFSFDGSTTINEFNTNINEVTFYTKIIL